MAKRTLLVCLVVTAMLALTAGVALAVTKQCNDEYDYVCRGTQGADTLLGTNDSDDIRGLGGDDKLEGRGEPDALLGGGGGDSLLGGYGSDYLSGDAGNDALFGGIGGDLYVFTGGWDRDTIVDGAQAENDPNQVSVNQSVTSGVAVNLVPSASRSEIRTLDGGNTVNWTYKTIVRDVRLEGRGDDLVSGNNAGNFIDGEGSGASTGADKVYASGGSDLVSVADGDGDDFVDCGEGDDTVYYSPGDELRNCEVQEERQP